MSDLPPGAVVCDVTLRDGLQNESAVLNVAQKVKIARMLRDAGIRVLEIGSLVNPQAVPQMANTEEVFRELSADPACECRVLVLNPRGLERAIAAGMKKVKVTVSVSPAHQRRNAGCSPAEMFDRLAPMAELARENGVTLSGALATAFGCPFSGEVPAAAVRGAAERFIGIGVRELSLSDTAGAADPGQVYRLCSELRDGFPGVAWNLHFHDSGGLGEANVLAALRAGCSRFDACAGGLGGCPTVPGAPGNIATGDLVRWLEREGVRTGISPEGVSAAAAELFGMLGRPAPGGPALMV